MPMAIRRPLPARPAGRGHADSDIKLIWEAARFPQAYYMARAAALIPEQAGMLYRAWATQVEGFLDLNPFDQGPHWHSSQEVALRTFAWLFGRRFSLSWAAKWRPSPDGWQRLFFKRQATSRQTWNTPKRRLQQPPDFRSPGALCGRLHSARGRASAWRERGKTLLDSQAERQVYPDGGYIQQSHTYHRFALQLYQMASAYAGRGGRDLRTHGIEPPTVARLPACRSGSE